MNQTTQILLTAIIAICLNQLIAQAQNWYRTEKMRRTMRAFAKKQAESIKIDAIPSRGTIDDFRDWALEKRGLCIEDANKSPFAAMIDMEKHPVTAFAGKSAFGKLSDFEHSLVKVAETNASMPFEIKEDELLIVSQKQGWKFRL